MKAPTYRHEWVLITPMIALEWLACNILNRNCLTQTILRYSKAMMDRRWFVTHQAIAFDSDGRLIDGQNRLWAIVDSNTSQYCLVVWGLPPEVRMVVDRNRVRTQVEAIRLSLKATGNEALYPGEIDGRRNSIARLFYETPQFSSSSFTEHDTMTMLIKLGETIEWAISNIGTTKGTRHRALYTVVVRAIRCPHRTSKKRISEFCTAIRDGSITDKQHDGAAIKARDIVRDAQAAHAQSYHQAVMLYRKLQVCLNAFLQYESPKSIRSTDDDLFPISDDDKMDLVRTSASRSISFKKKQRELLEKKDQVEPGVVIRKEKVA